VVSNIFGRGLNCKCYISGGNRIFLYSVASTSILWSMRSPVLYVLEVRGWTSKLSAYPPMGWG